MGYTTSTTIMHGGKPPWSCLVVNFKRALWSASGSKLQKSKCRKEERFCRRRLGDNSLADAGWGTIHSQTQAAGQFTSRRRLRRTGAEDCVETRGEIELDNFYSDRSNRTLRSAPHGCTRPIPGVIRTPRSAVGARVDTAPFLSFGSPI